MTIRGKRGNVPAILTKDMQESLNLLMELKMKHNPAPNNHYLFPARDSKKHQRGGYGVTDLYTQGRTSGTSEYY